MGRDTARLNVQLGTTAECLPEPPATTTKTSSAEGTRGSRASGSVVAFIHAGQSCMPYMPPSRMSDSGCRAFSYTNLWTSARVKPSLAMVRACSGPSTTMSWACEKYQPTLEPSDTAVSATLVRMPLAGLRPAAVTWGDPATWPGFLAHFFRREYGTFRLGDESLGSAGAVGPRLGLFGQSVAHGSFYVVVPLGLAALATSSGATGCVVACTP